jgi:hypothetical protein
MAGFDHPSHTGAQWLGSGWSLSRRRYRWAPMAVPIPMQSIDRKQRGLRIEMAAQALDIKLKFLDVLFTT